MTVMLYDSYEYCSSLKMGRSIHCSPEERALIKKLISEGKSYRKVQEIVGCSSKMISNALKYEIGPENRGRKR